MITKISKLKNFGVFSDFTWDKRIPNFNKFNLIYGWNRSGKTTISRVFESCEKKCTYDAKEFKEYPENGEFEITLDQGTKIKDTNVTSNTLPIKVFNRDFVEDNISFDSSDSCNPIVYVSEEDIESKKRLDDLKLENVVLNEKYEQLNQERKSKEDSKNLFLRYTGRETGNAIFNKNYTKNHVEKRIEEIGVDNFQSKILSEEDRKKYINISRSDAGSLQQLFPEYAVSIHLKRSVLKNFQNILENVNELLNREIVSATINRLKDDADLNSWVKEGFDLHQSKKERKHCLFCQSPLEENFLDTLSRHFSKDYECLQDDIKVMKDELTKLKYILPLSDSRELSQDLKQKYLEEWRQLESCNNELDIWIKDVIKLLDKKYSNPFVKVQCLDTPKDFCLLLNNHIRELNVIINQHNKRVNNHSVEVSKAKEKVELDTIARALKDRNYKKMLSELESIKNKEEKALEDVKKNNDDLGILEKKTSNIEGAIEKINSCLTGLFGRDEILLTLDENKKGYKITRGGNPVKTLSEGEKTSIALSYFVVKADEEGFDKTKGVFFIDDPISSLDQNFIYYCFSMIKNNFNEVDQLFISTHNFQLFNLVKEWFMYKNDKAKKNNKPQVCEFFMLENYIESDVRKAKIVKLEKTLLDYKSEYHFLFAKLNEFVDKSKSTVEYSDLYTLGNMARRFLEIYVDFKIPKVSDLKSKIQSLVKSINKEKEIVSKIDEDMLYKLINEYSHNSDPLSAVEHKDKTECENAIKVLLKIVEESDSEHFKILKESTSK